MTKDDKIDQDFRDLRRQAERLVKRLASDQDVSTLSPEDIRNLIHELQVHQAELEMQNEELRRAQEVIELSRDRYADLYDFAPIGYFTLSPEGIILEVNLSGAALVHGERSRLIKKPFLTMVAPAHRQTFYHHLRTVTEQRVKHSCELILTSGSKDEIWVRMESIVGQATDGGRDVVRTAVSDISEVKRMQQEVLAVEERVLSDMAEGVCLCDVTGRISFTNGPLERMLGYDSGELLGKYLADLGICISRGDEDLQEILSRSFADSKWRGEWSCLHKQGSTLEIYVRTAMVDLFEKQSLIVMWEDITELKKAHESLIDSEQRLRAIFESVGDLVYLKDRSLTYTKVNPAFEKMLGKASEDIVGRGYEELFGQEGAAYEKDVDLRVLEGQTVEEERGREVNGTVRRFQEVRSPLENSDGDVTGICAIARDITERRASQVPLPKETRRPKSKVMQATLERAIMAAKQRSVVLLRGESGTGKDYLASFIHNHSDRAAGPYYSINCAALTETLAESELFGHERGSFTGAHARKRGLLELAEGGTLLLNEVGDLSPLLQAKLLTFLDTRKLMRVGGQKEISINARIMAATNKDLEADVAAGRFRKDLYYRLSVMIIELPPLRSRTEDIPDLAEVILHDLAQKLGHVDVPDLDAETISTFQRYSWPGNVRELKNVLERTLILGKVPPLGIGSAAMGDGQGDYSLTLRFGSGTTLRELTDEVTRSLCIEALRRCQGNKKEAAKLLGIARDSLYRHLKQFDLERDNLTR